MKYTIFENIMSQPRMSRYLVACGQDSRKAMTLYRLNLKVSQELFTIISCFEIALRNAIDKHYRSLHGEEWLKDAVEEGGMFDNKRCKNTQKIISRTLLKLNQNYSHSKLIAEMEFGLWRYLFSQPQFNAGGKTLLKIFPSKPASSQSVQYNNKYVFNQLQKINMLRNRIAHHEPVCFLLGTTVKDITYAKQHYTLIKELFNWMEIDESSLLYGIDHVNQTLAKIDAL